MSTDDRIARTTAGAFPHTAAEYARLAHFRLADVRQGIGDATIELAKAQVYATLAVAAAYREVEVGEDMRDALTIPEPPWQDTTGVQEIGE